MQKLKVMENLTFTYTRRTTRWEMKKHHVQEHTGQSLLRSGRVEGEAALCHIAEFHEELNHVSEEPGEKNRRTSKVLGITQPAINYRMEKLLKKASLVCTAKDYQLKKSPRS